MGQMIFDRSRLIRRAVIELESRHPTEGARVSDRDKKELERSIAQNGMCECSVFHLKHKYELIYFGA